MKKHNKIRVFLSTCLAALTAVFCGVLISTAPVKANAETLASTVYQTDGASVRVFKKNLEGELESTDKTGIRFHVETGAGYQIATDMPLLDVNDTTTNKNGAYKMADGYKSYTLVLPKRLMGGSSDLTADLANVEKIETTGYWFRDKDGNWESVAYIYNIPETWYTDTLVYRGVICSVAEDGTETPVKWTSMTERSLTWVAKQAYNDTIDENTNYWGTAEKDNTAAPLIKAFIPTYTVTYENGETEEVLWGDTLTKANSEKTYYDETNHESIDVTLPLEMTTSCSMTLAETTESTFVLTGVVYTTTGFNVYATLPTGKFNDGTELTPSAVDMVTGAGNTVTANSVTVCVEGSGDNAKSHLAIAFDYTNITNGTTLTILKSSHFYNDGVLYELEEDYTFTYNNETWELPLGQITLGDIEEIINFTESSGDEVEKNIRIIFKSDILINGEATLENGAITITRANEKNENGTAKVDEITDAYYYWNQGNHKILEIPGNTGGNMWGEVNGDVLTIPAGLEIRQNGGYYVVQEEIKATFNGGTNWGFSYTQYDIGSTAFTEAYTSQAGDSIYIDVVTSSAWATSMVKVVCNEGTITYNHTNNVTQFCPNEIYYHGENGHKILRIHLDSFSELGDWVTIPKGTEFWVGSNIYVLTEDITSYYVSKANVVAMWVTNPTITEISQTNIKSMGWNQSNIRYTTDTVWSTTANNHVIVDDTFINGDGVTVTGSNYSGFFYYGGENSLLELQGLEFSATGGSATIKAGTILWLFASVSGQTPTYTSAYKLTEDITIEVSGATGSQMYKDVAVATVSKSNIASVANDGSHDGEIRFNLNDKIVTEMYGTAVVEGSATLNGKATTSAFVYAYLSSSSSPYTGNTIIAFTGTDFGGAFQASVVGDRVSIAAGTKIWLSNGSGYITIEDEWNYVWNGSSYVQEVDCAVTFSGDNATVAVNGEAVKSATVKTGESLTFTVTLSTGYKIASITGGATLVSENDNVYTYTFANVWSNVEVAITAAEPIKISQSDVISIWKESDTEIRFALDQDNRTDDIAKLTGGNYDITHSGETELVIGGAQATPTQYNYYGIIDGTNYQYLGVNCDAVSMVSGDYLTLKAGSTFAFGGNVLLLESDITAKMVSVTANFDSSVCVINLNTVGANSKSLTNGKAYTTFVGATAKIVYGWQSGMDAKYNFTSFKINGGEQGTDGTYDVALSGDVVIDVATELKTFTVSFSGDNATVAVNGETVTSATVAYGGSVTFTPTANDDYAIFGASNATNNGDGTYTVSNVTANVAVVVTAKKIIELGADSVSAIQVYKENSYTGVRIDLDETKYTALADADMQSNSNYGATMIGSTSLTIAASPNTTFDTASTYNYFGSAGALLELRFDTSNLAVGDTFVIAAGTIFNHTNMGRAIKFTEEIVGVYSGSAWISNPVNKGELNWNTIVVESIYSYSDVVDEKAITHTIRMNLGTALFDGVTGTGFAVGTVTIEDKNYTGGWTYHGGTNKILQISEWEYANGQTLVIKAGTKIYIGSSYYVTTNTLTATCKANGSGAEWEFTIS